ncbi:hypothetical protein [Umezawaea sp. Da 62-37]|uniref:hypothetical protein n=1 Tax=Umezawaea sp. Da 62-37 TaxID=3075927 RepID=UPI0028F70AD2|nr:hypothetical protein [Umezawaea sp. Da 62-37]WNV88309.1 hypothetical protein RM788_08430 [Umezawaea sp. Da 62-37]
MVAVVAPAAAVRRLPFGFAWWLSGRAGPDDLRTWFPIPAFVSIGLEFRVSTSLLFRNSST